MLCNSFQGFIFLLTFATLCLFYSRCNAFKLPPPGLNGPVSLKGTTSTPPTNGTDDGDMTPSVISCWDEGVPMIDNVPSPVTCNQYFSCHIKGTPHSPEGTPMDCQVGYDGQLLFYDFRRCLCDYKENALCFDEHDESHIQDFYICAQNYIPEEN